MRPGSPASSSQSNPRFNSRTPGGVRPSEEGLSVDLRKFQFTHPGRGATYLDYQQKEIHLRFNSRTPGGVRRSTSLKPYAAYTFQFTHPGRGATKPMRPSRSHPQSFNSRTPGGVRLGEYTHLTDSLVFQFTHPGRGATLLRAVPRCSHQVSIHAPREGCDSDDLHL